MLVFDFWVSLLTLAQGRQGGLGLWFKALLVNYAKRSLLREDDIEEALEIAQEAQRQLDMAIYGS